MKQNHIIAALLLSPFMLGAAPHEPTEYDYELIESRIKSGLARTFQQDLLSPDLTGNYHYSQSLDLEDFRRSIRRDAEAEDGDQEVMEEYVITTQNYGEVGSFLNDKHDIWIKNLIIIGKMNQADFRAIWNYASKQRILLLDLSQVEMEENKVPAYALYDSIQLDEHYAIQIEEIILPEGIVEIGKYAFMSSILRKINIPSTVRQLGEGMLSSCKFLNCELVFPEGLEVIPRGICNYSYSMTIPPSFPSTLKEIGDVAFQQTRLESLELPENLEKVGMFAFMGYNSIKDLVIPDKCTDIGMGAFAGMMWLETVKLPDNLEYIPDNMLSGAYSLTEIVLPTECKVVGQEAFADDFEATVVLNKKLERIEDSGFRNIRMGQVVLPATLKYIGCDALASPYYYDVWGCEAVEPPVCFSNPEKPWLSPFTTEMLKDVVLEVPVGSQDLYRQAWGWKDFGTIGEYRGLGVDGVSAEEQESDSRLYDLTGRAVGRPMKNTIYIRNGEKVIFR